MDTPEDSGMTTLARTSSMPKSHPVRMKVSMRPSISTIPFSLHFSFIMLRSLWKSEGDLRSFSDFTFYNELSAMQDGNFIADGESDSIGRVGCLSFVELLLDLVDIRF